MSDDKAYLGAALPYNGTGAEGANTLEFNVNLWYQVSCFVMCSCKMFLRFPLTLLRFFPHGLRALHSRAIANRWCTVP